MSKWVSEVLFTFTLLVSSLLAWSSAQWRPSNNSLAANQNDNWTKGCRVNITIIWVHHQYTMYYNANKVGKRTQPRIVQAQLSCKCGVIISSKTMLLVWQISRFQCETFNAFFYTFSVSEGLCCYLNSWFTCLQLSASFV